MRDVEFRLPFARPDVLTISPVYRTLRDRGPVTEILTREGTPAWLVIGYRQVRELMADSRLERLPPDQARARGMTNAAMGPGDQHLAMRRLLTSALSGRRLLGFLDEVRRIVTDVLDGLERRTAVVDVHEELAVVLPMRVISAFLGVPESDWRRFRAWSAASGITIGADPAAVAAARSEMMAYFLELVAVKRAEPADDLISDLVQAGLPDPQIAGLCSAGMFAGHETTTPRIDSGLLLLSRHRDARQALRDDLSLVESAVEEILRMPVPGADGPGVPRFAHEEVVIGDVTVATGDQVLLAGTAANFDPEVFPDPFEFDIRRNPNPHLTFGHGSRFCLGSNLARLELRELFGQVVSRFPNYELACAEDELRPRTDLITGGLAELPIHL